MALRTKERTQESAKSLTRAKAVHTGAAHTPAIPLDIASLLGPYRRHGRLALRIEQMPQTSRMSRGRNNGDCSWSVAEHELDDLSYHPPEGAIEDHALMVRVVGLDQDGASLAVLSVPISIKASQSPSRTVTHIKLASAANDTDRISDRGIEIAALEKRAAENLETARAEWQREAGENLARTQAALKAEHAAQLAAAESRWKEEVSRFKATEEKKQSESAKEPITQPDAKVLARLRDALTSLTEDLASRNATLTDAQAQIAKIDAERERLRSELSRATADIANRPNNDEIQKLQDALNSAEANLASRDADLAGALAQIARQQTEFTKLSEDLSRTQRATSAKPDSSELQMLQETLKSAETSLGNRDADLAEAHARIARYETEFAQQRAELSRALADAAAKPNPDELQILRDALKLAETNLVERGNELSQSREELKKAQAEAASRPDATEMQKLQDALKSSESTLAGREVNLVDAFARISKQETEFVELRAELARAQRDAAAKPSEDELRRVQETLTLAKADLSSRDATLTEARLQIAKHGDDAERLRVELAAAQTSGATKESALVEQSERLRAELAAARTAIAGYESAAAELRKNLTLAENRWQKHSEELLANAKSDWEKSHASRVAAAETSARTLQSRCRELETQLRESEVVLADIRRRSAQAGATRHESADTADLRAQLCELQVAFAERESELAKMRTLPGENRRHDDDAIVLRSNRLIEGLDDARGLRRARPLALDLAIVAAVCMAVVFYLPRIESFLPDSWAYAINSTVYDVQTALGAQPATVATTAPADPITTSALPHATILRTANVHTGPKASDSVAFTLQHGIEVDMVEHHGNWVHVRAMGKDAKTQEGWVFNTFLQEDKDSATAK